MYEDDYPLSDKEIREAQEFREFYDLGEPAETCHCLIYLDLIGWSELIDTRWRRQVEKELRNEFGDRLSEEVLAKAMTLVLFPDKELPEDEYEYLDELNDEYTLKLKQRLGIQ